MQDMRDQGHPRSLQLLASWSVFAHAQHAACTFESSLVLQTYERIESNSHVTNVNNESNPCIMAHETHETSGTCRNQTGKTKMLTTQHCFLLAESFHFLFWLDWPNLKSVFPSP